MLTLWTCSPLLLDAALCLGAEDVSDVALNVGREEITDINTDTEQLSAMML